MLRSRKLLSLLALASLTACAAQQAQTLPAEQPTAPAAVVEKVNGTVITRTELERATKGMMEQYRMSGDASPELRKQVQAAALNQLTASELLFQEAQKTEIQDLEKKVAKKVAEDRARYATEDAYDAALKGIGLTREEMTQMVRKEVVIDAFIEQKFAKQTVVTDEEAKKFYEENLKKYFSHGERVRASHILVAADEKASAQEKGKAKDKAEALLKRIKAGEDFAKVAQEDSSCPSKTKGGDLGIIERGKTVPAFEDAVFALHKGELSNVVETRFGYHIIKLTDRFPATTDSFESVKERISSFLKVGKVKEMVASFIEELRSKAKIEKG